MSLTLKLGSMHLNPTLLAADGPLVGLLRAQLPNAMAVYAFGSQIQGITGPDSDLDLAVLVQIRSLNGSWLANWQMWPGAQ